MVRRSSVAAFLALAALVVASLGGGSPAGAAPGVGEVRAVQVREGAVLWREARALSGIVTRVTFGGRVTVDEVAGAWVRVTADAGGTGWLRGSEIVEPGALTSAAARAGATTRAGSGAPTELSLAGRQFDETLEAEFMASEADVARAYGLVDALEAKSIRPGDPATERFLREGGLGNTGVGGGR